MESCSVAARLFGVDHAEVLPGIEPVRNASVALTGHQAEGYAVVPVYGAPPGFPARSLVAIVTGM
ncbi:hypothetical protein TK90_1661 [Thioalkalivibrio sp. K90mix]|nr:hypothetical protein TK90_1661 [Thioalkalivibrio sp. K90mix]